MTAGGLEVKREAKNGNVLFCAAKVLAEHPPRLTGSLGDDFRPLSAALLNHHPDIIVQRPPDDASSARPSAAVQGRPGRVVNRAGFGTACRYARERKHDGNCCE